MKKLTDEELSRVLTAHEEKELKKGGTYSTTRISQGGGGLGCLMQVACADKDAPWSGSSLIDEARWFDSYYQPTWSSDKFLEELELVGIA